MAEIINTFVDNETLTDQNSLIHLLPFDKESDDLIHLIEPSFCCIMTGFINKISSDNCTLMSLNCQNLNAKFSNIKLRINLFVESTKALQVLCDQETWLGNVDLPDMGQFHIDNYHLLTKMTTPAITEDEIWISNQKFYLSRKHYLLSYM